MITSIIIAFVIFKVFGKGNPLKKQQMKVPVCDEKANDSGSKK